MTQWVSPTTGRCQKLTDTDAIALLEGLVRIPSISGQEQDAVNWLVTHMTALGFDAHVDEVGNAIGSIGEGLPQTVLLGHIDTVPGTINVRHEDGRLYGRGTVDAKGPLAAFVAAAARLRSAGTITGQIVVIGCVEEEVPSSRGAHAVAERYAPTTCIVGEPSGWNGITLGYKGVLRTRCQISTPTAHSAHDRQTAAEQLVEFWQQIQSYVEVFNVDRTRAFDRLQPSLLGLSSGSDGITDWATADLSIRLPLGVDPQKLADTLRSLTPNIAIHVLGATPAYQGERNTSLVRALSRAIREYNVQPRLVVKTGTADLNIVGPAWHCPAVAYGPGDAALDHTPSEHIVLDEYLYSIEILRAALAELHCPCP